MTTYQHIQANKRKTAVLIFLFVLFIIILGWVFAEVLGYGSGAIVIATIFATATSLIGYYSGDAIALRTSGAVPISKEHNAYVYRLVENLCITAGMPTPKIYVIDDPTMNAFATGRNPEKASIAVTTGLVAGLENEELEGVIAHELSHIKNYDIRVMTIVIVLVGMVSLLANWFLHFSFFGGRRSNDRSDNQLGAILAIVGIILSILSPIAANLIQLAVSRKREFLADSSAALLTRYPEGLARALEKIDRSNIRPLASASPATAHLYISNPFGSEKRSFLSHLFSTHPPAQQRIKILRGMA
ncbi:MAG: zinc metalloprotease HtpX [Candidatus Kerfeldbacteria bacterium RIFCSPHIGHO2_12_FULL_48_17]|uniref:Protease HtpX homolog n=1 Tax=Candidatus Kerfeldbacteria bacterium RIFCSPHIGHO2_12_FULL_48_17 TaxID=1798542 RepID=A0A1G2B5K0_9BACT|nr:MAG: zinc metalloprotease HtpX [Candidatus Kerfeldbacteria bacterium RIFCSPHIGHO2_12_FULL_48_17]